MIDDADADAFDGFTYVGGMNATSPRNPTADNTKTENKSPEEIKAGVVEEKKQEEVKVAAPKSDPAPEVKTESNQSTNEHNKPVEDKKDGARVEIVAEVLLSPKSATSEEDIESESSDVDSDSSDSELEHKDENSSSDSGTTGPFIVRLPGQQ